MGLVPKTTSSIADDCATKLLEATGHEKEELRASKLEKVEIGGCRRNNGNDMGSVTVRHVRQGCDVMCETWGRLMVLLP